MSLRTAAFLVSAVVASAAQAQEMPAPTYVVGDAWTYRETDLLTKQETGRVVETVVKADAAEYWIDSRRRARTWWRGDAVKRFHREQFEFAEGGAEQRGKTIATNDGGCAYPWPLKVGQSWECSEMTTWPNGWKIKYDVKFTVEAAEKVETPAGSFDTLRLVGKGFSANETNGATARQERIFWLSPTTKREVKHEIRSILKNNTIFRAEGRELVEFKPGA